MRSEKKHALFVIGSLESGGTENQLLQVLPNLAKHGWFADLLPLAGPTPLAGAFESAGVRVLRKPARTGTKARRVIAAITSLSKACFSQRYDVVMLCLSMAYTVGAPVALMSGRAPICMMRRNVNDRQVRFPLSNLERAMHRYCSGFMVNAPDLVDQLVNEGASPDRISFVRNGIDLSRFDSSFDRDSLRKSLGVGKEQIVILCVANFHSYKRHVDVIRAFGGLASIRSDVHLWLAGRKGDADTVIEAEIASQGIRDRVTLLGQRDDVPALARAADIGILLSSQEGTPNAVLESMASRLPVVASNLPGTRDALGADGLGPCDCGWLVPVGDPRAACAALAALASNLDKRRAASEAARERVERVFSLSAAAAGYSELLDAVVERNRR